jgi:Protein of unknown function (DUF2589)
MEELRMLLLSLQNSVLEANTKINTKIIDQFKDFFDHVDQDSNNRRNEVMIPKMLQIQVTPPTQSGIKAFTMEVPLISLITHQIFCIKQIVIKIKIWITQESEGYVIRLHAPQKRRGFLNWIFRHSRKTVAPVATEIEMTIGAQDDETVISEMINSYFSKYAGIIS